MFLYDFQAHEITILEMLVLLMQNPTDDSIEVLVSLLKECGAMLHKVTPKGNKGFIRFIKIGNNIRKNTLCLSKICSKYIFLVELLVFNNYYNLIHN